MPINILVGILAIIIALVLYSIGVWGSFRSGKVSRRRLIVLWVGFGFDVLATLMMAIQAKGINNDLHSILALIALAGMLLFISLSTWAYRHHLSNAQLKIQLTRWMLAPYLLWVFVFVWGMIERGSTRLIH